MDKGWRTVLMGIVKSHDLLYMRLGQAQIAQPEQDFPQYLVHLHEASHVLLVLSQGQHLRCQNTRSLQFCAHRIKCSQSPQHLEEVLSLSHLPAQLKSRV